MQTVARRFVRAVTLPLAVLLLATAFTPQAQASPRERIRPSFFGVDITIGAAGVASWPAFTPGAVRIALPWNDIERSSGVFDWAQTDVKMATVEQHGARPLIVFQNTPSFHAMDPSSASLASAPRLPAFRRFVRSLVTRYGDSADYQVWNEPNVPIFYTGTPAHMVRMTRVVGEVVHRLAPGATVVAPNFPLRIKSNRVWFKDYWSQRLGGARVADFVDAANISAYPMPDEGPEQALQLTRWARGIVGRFGFHGPLWASEINYGANGLAPTPKISARRQAAFVVRTYALHANLGADRVYWWRWEPHQTVNTQLQDGYGNLTRAGTAYGVVKDWLLGTRPGGCSLDNGLRTCRFRARGGIDRVVIWTRSGRSRTVVAPARALSRTSSSGVVREVEPGRRFRVGRTPVMVEIRRR